MSEASELHNRLAGSLMVGIVKPVVEAGGSPEDVMVLLESVAAGVITFVAGQTIGGLTADDIVDLLAAGLKKRLPDMRLAGLDVMGSA